MSNRLGASPVPSPVASPVASPLHLDAREILDIRDGEGLRVSSLRGVLWITQANDTDDIVVRAGESFVLDRPGLAIVSAPIGSADLIVQARSDHARERAGFRSQAA
jgi:hypothetical protein